MRQISSMSSSNTPCVEGYVTMMAARSSACFSAFARRSSTSTFPWSSHFTTTTFMPAMTALAGFVPCADAGIRQMRRWPWPVCCRYSRMTSMPAYSPWAPLFGWNETAAKPVISASQSASDSNSST